MDEMLERVRDRLPGAVEKPMFGGIGFMVDGYLLCSVSARGLLVRVEPDELDELATAAGVEPMAMGGRTSKGWLRIDPDVVAGPVDLGDWLARAERFVAGLPPRRIRNPRTQ